jgi:DNA-binding transcriptional LysR family regulator
MDTFELIRTFREVAARGSFVQAANALTVSRANVSKYVAELEARLGVRLLNRSTHTVSLTDAGRLLLERSTPLMEMMAATQAELQERADVPSGQLRLTAPHGLDQTELSRLLAAFMTRYPRITICLDLNNHVVDMIDEGVDLALRVGRIHDASLIVRRLRPVSFVVCATPDYWAAHGRPSHPDELATHDALLFSLPDSHPEWHFEVDGQPHRVPMHGRMAASDTTPLVGVALQGLGVVCLPDLMLRPHLESGALEPVLQGFAPHDVWLYAAYAQRRHNSAALRALLASLEAHWRTG